MTLKVNTAEGGTNGTTVTTGNSGGASGNAFNAVTINGASTLTYDNSRSMHGFFSYKYHCVSGSTTFTDWTGYTATTMPLEFYFMFGTLPSAAAGVRLADVRDSGGTPVGIGRVAVNSANKLMYQNNGSTLYTAGAAISALTWYRVDMLCGNNTAPYKFDYYPGDSTSPVEPGFANASQASGSANTIATVRWGNSGSNTFTGDLWIVEKRANDGATGYIGPTVAPAFFPFC